MPAAFKPSDLDTHWKRLGLEAIESTARIGDTVTANGVAQTFVSQGALTRPTEASPELTLPNLTLAPPAATAPGPIEAPELVPISVLGEGGMGRVYVARQSALDREVAVKVLKEGQSKGALGLVTEARITGGLEHPNIIPIYALGSSDAGLPAVVMKRVDGVSWQDLLFDDAHPGWARLLRNGTDRIEANVRLLMQVCDALAFAHRRGIVHRDLKPANVLVGELGEVYLADWGVAMPLVPRDAPPSKPQLVGTPAYMSPEMALGDVRQIDARSDVYLLGATLSEVLTGRPPHTAGEVREALKLALESQAVAFPDDAPAELVKTCHRAMAPDPDDRFQSALDFRLALADFLAHRGSAQLAAAARRRLEELKSAVDGTDQVSTSGQSLKARSTWAVFAEARFGFTQALESWADNLDARMGLADAIETMTRLELRQGNLKSARALAAELTAVPPDLAEELDALATRLEAEQRRFGRLTKLEHELDLSVSAGQRKRFVIGMSIAAAVTALAMVVIRPMLSSRDLDQPLLVASAGSLLVLFTLGFWLQRRTLLANAINRRLSGYILFSAGGFVLHRVLGWVMNTPIADIVAGDSVLAASTSAFAAIAVHRRLAWSAIAMALAAVGASLVPQHAPSVFGAGIAVALGLTATLLRPGREEPLERD